MRSSIASANLRAKTLAILQSQDFSGGSIGVPITPFFPDWSVVSTHRQRFLSLPCRRALPRFSRITLGDKMRASFPMASTHHSSHLRHDSRGENRHALAESCARKTLYFY